MSKGKHRGASGPKSWMNHNAKVPFRFVTTFNASSSGTTVSTLDLQLSVMGARLAAMNTLFKRWRLNHLKVKVVSDTLSTAQISAGSAGITLASGYLGTASTNVSAAPTTIAEIAALLFSDVNSGAVNLKYTVPSSTLAEARSSNWLLTSSAGSVPSDSTEQGCIFTGLLIGQTLATGSVRVHVVYTGEAEFCEPTTPSVSLEEGRAVLRHWPLQNDDEKEECRGRGCIPPLNAPFVKTRGDDDSDTESLCGAKALSRGFVTVRSAADLPGRSVPRR